jgi:hypothetical protein
MNLPKGYVDETGGVRPGFKEASFNNVVFLTWYMVVRDIQGTLNQTDLDSMHKHLELNNDEYGLYKPKNSHDNVSYKMILSEYFGLNLTEDMNFLKAIKDIGMFRLWDVIMYGSVFGPRLLRPLFRLFLFIPALQMLQAIWVPVDGKVRPKWVDGKNSRILWWFTKDLISVEETEVRKFKSWNTPFGVKVSSHMQNDGKHLAVFRLLAFKDRFWIFRLTAKIARKKLIKMYGEDYTYGIIFRYFLDRKHPLIKMWKGYGDVLKENENE